ncbi:MAG TPA: TIM-barrel domain-containing protein [Paucimonas sp.]|nr:TIM-barrel domain-containing protein [Paucimonas sp.]
MYFHKVETTNNFVFSPQESQNIVVRDHGSDVFRLRVESARWPRGSDSFAHLTPDEFAARPSRAALTVGAGGELRLDFLGATLLRSEAGRGFGVCGRKWLFALPYNEGDRFYGMGEKNIGFELSKKRTCFWNTDVFADFNWHQIEHGATDPMYASFPVLIIKTGGCWVGIVIDNPYAVFMNTGADEGIFQPGAGPFVPELFFGSRDGRPDVWIAVDERPDALVRKLQTLQGRTPLPPLWALGHQQCRWGYKSYDDLARVADEYQKHGIPNDGLWLDIDYMDGFRVFTVDGAHFPEPQRQIAALTERGHRVVPILDPGLRRDPDYPVYAEAKRRDVLCKTIEGQDYIGYVWPGYTVFPDYSLEDGRAFWAEQVRDFTRLGFGGYWIDMNDPSTGSAPLDDMRFARGALPHEVWHNQYALGMAVATREGMQLARPDERPFIVSRSGFLSQARHSALWTGDNMSNEHHMKGAIALSLNLSVSGMPFNGPDVPGFALHASAELMRAWYKLGFLFPFLRNHKIKGQPDQEPWTRDEQTTAIVCDYIRLRYKLLPYLYNLFIEQSERGDPMLRPVWYHDPAPEFERCDDMFFAGHAILQAPFVEPAAASRSIRLPRHRDGASWYDVLGRRFVAAGAVVEHGNTPETTPLFLASPSAIPMQTGVRTDNRNDLRDIEILLALEPGASVSMLYRADDGISYAWQKGKRSALELLARHGEQGVEITLRMPENGYGRIAARILLLGPAPSAGVRINGREAATEPATIAFAGTTLEVAAIDHESISI